MDVFNTRDELIGQQEHGLQREFAVAKVEQIFQARAKKVEDHSIIITFCTEPTNEWDPDTASKRLVDTGFILELRVFGFDALQLNGYLFAGDDVGT